MSDTGRGSLLLSLTLTELALILFFLLLLLSLLALDRKDEIIERVTGAEPALQEAVVEAVAFIEENPDEDFVHLIRQASQFRETQDRFEKTLAELQSENQALREELAHQHADPEKLARLETAFRNCVGRYRNCERRVASAGHGLPPCWSDPETGKAEYLYRIEIRERDLGVSPRWPDHRRRELPRIPGARDLVAPSLSVPEFQRHAEKILRWSRNQTPECRHYVILADHATTKDGYKDKRLLVENFFYKYEERR